MDFGRLPRKFLVSWVANSRPHGRPQQNFGHSLASLLRQVGAERGLNSVSTDVQGCLAVWGEIARDKDQWRYFVHGD